MTLLADRSRRVPLHPREGFLPRLLEQRRVAHEMRHPKLRHPGLAGAEEVARPADLEVFLGESEAVVAFHHDLEALPRVG